MEAFKNLINGQWLDALDGATFGNRNPANPDEVLGTFPSTTRQDARRADAVTAGRETGPGWANTPPPARGAILDRTSQVIAARFDEMTKVLGEE